uniref:Integrase catalytic domain-containing protein n=1 Tax=Scophthalmus maximus TaxID=52904 RepID=A0A8D3CS75_SCOMX
CLAPRIRGRVGQPRCLITEEQLQFLLSFNFTVQQIADILGVSRRTVTQRLRQHNITIRGRYSNMTNAELDERVIDLVHGNDELGPDAVRARLFGEGIVVQRRRVRQSLLRTNPAGAALRAMSHRLHRRKYRVAGPNSLWHLDGNHKLIRWRIVIHGGIDGFSRMIVFLQASNNNRSSTVMEQFVQAVDQFGVPSRVRCDHGGENNAVCLFMDVFEGQIERLWRDVWNGLSNVYHSLFTLLEQDGILDINSETHLWALQYVYMPRIDRDLQHFVNQWNHHGLRTTRYMSPYRMFVRGCLRLQSQNLTERVAVPANTFAVEPGRLQELQHRVDPLAGSRDRMGVDLLQEVLSFLLS